MRIRSRQAEKQDFVHCGVCGYVCLRDFVCVSACVSFLEVALYHSLEIGCRESNQFHRVSTL